MAAKKKSERKNIENTTVEELRNIVSLLQDLLILELASKGVKQAQIRNILKVDMRRVTRILKHFKN